MSLKILDGRQVDVPHDDSAGHWIYLWNCTLMYCPVDGRMHRFGCSHARGNIFMVPGSLRSFYQTQWAAQESSAAAESDNR